MECFEGASRLATSKSALAYPRELPTEPASMVRFRWKSYPLILSHASTWNLFAIISSGNVWNSQPTSSGLPSFLIRSSSLMDPIAASPAATLLPKGTLVHIHDIFLPSDYSSSLYPRSWSEQYLLGGSRDYDMILPCAYLIFDTEASSHIAGALQSDSISGSGFWMKRVS